MNVINKINNASSIWEILPQLNTKELEEAIKTAADSYYNTGTSLVSDEVYDVLVDRLKKLKPNSKILKEVGAPVRGRKEKLPYWLGSMDKIKSDDKLISNWTNIYKGPYVISDKIDGISCLLTMFGGKIKLYTRGNGTYGQDISHLSSLANMSINKLSKLTNMNVAIRGELVMSKENFEKYANIMSNARNMVGGIVNSKPESINKKYAANVDFIAYEVIEPWVIPSEQMKLLKKWGLNVVYYDIYKKINLNILDSILNNRKKKSIYEIDGIIVTDNNKHPRNKSGNPAYAFAYKGLTETANVKVLKVIWHASKDGYLEPIVHYQTVKLSGADLKYAAGFNAKYIVDNKIGKGAIITVTRSGGVIPYITNIVKPAKEPDLPEDLDYHWDKNHVNIILKNPNENEEVIIARLTRFIKYIGVENLSEGIITKLVKAGYDTIPKIILLRIDDFLSLEGFQKKLATKLYDNLQIALNNIDMLTLMAASNIFGRGFGERKLKKILDVYPNIVQEYSIKTHDVWFNKLMTLEGFDTITIDQFLEELPKFQRFYKEISKLINVKPYRKQIKKAGLFQGDVVVVTGFRSKPLEEFIESEGGRMASSVSKNTTLLIYNDGEESSAKYIKAKDLGIKTIARSQFSKKYGVS